MTRLSSLPLVVWLAASANGCGNERLPDEPALVNSVGMKFARVPAGEFTRGSADADRDASQDEKPRHKVRISQPFYLGVYEVTQAQYERVMGTNAAFFSGTNRGKAQVEGHNFRRFPVEQVTWYDAAEFCRRLSHTPEEKQARRVYRLPTEAEWEYACRAGTDTPFHFGTSLSSTEANFNGEYPAGGGKPGPFLARTTEVGSYPPNAWGFHDMHGNVWEWCSDWYGLDYYRETPAVDPAGPSKGYARVIRGGCWYSDARDCRSSFRYADIPTGVFYVMGFRVAMVHGDAAQFDWPTPDKRAKSDVPNRPAAVLADRESTPASLPGEDWPRWGGPRGDGTWHGPKLPLTWPADGLKRLWRRPIGGGYGGVAVAGGRVYVMDRKTEPDDVERVLAFDAASGEPLWSHQYAVDYKDVAYGSGPRTTPTVADGRVYTLGAVGHLHCLEADTGKPVWSKDLVREYQARVPLWGLAASPVIFDRLVIVHPAATPNGCIMAFDRQSGEEVWRSLPDDAGYATPILIESEGNRQLVCWTPSHVRGLDPRSGELRWSIPFKVTYGTSIATPIYHDHVVLVTGYYEGAKAIRLSPELAQAEILWEDRRNLRGLMTQPLQRDGYGYLLDKRHGLTCFELSTGRKIWDDGNRLTPKGRNPQATLVWLGDGDRVIALNSEGDLVLARFSPMGYHEQARTNIIGPTWAHPAYAGNRVYARSDSELVCVALPPAEASPTP